MVSWLERKFFDWGTRKQKAEVENWLGMLQAMNSDEMGMVVAMATDVRHRIETEFNTDLLKPYEAYHRNPTLLIELNRLVRDFQRRGEKTVAAGVMVWLFTLRGVAKLELRQSARDLWKELRRGMPHVDDATIAIYQITRKFPDTVGHDRIPEGVEPEVR